VREGRIWCRGGFGVGEAATASLDAGHRGTVVGVGRDGRP
jgi:hypothetical protein